MYSSANLEKDNMKGINWQSHCFSCGSGLFSFKNYQLMRVTDSLFRRSGRAVAKPIGVNLRIFNIL